MKSVLLINKKAMAMADKIKMSDNNNPGEMKNEDASQKTMGRRSGEKPNRMIYQPRSGMTLKRSDPLSNESWRSSKSPSPSPAELQTRNRQNHQVDINSEIDSNIIDQKLKELNISTDSQVIDLTLGSSNEEKKRIKKPEQPIYVPKPAKLDWAAQVEDENIGESSEKIRSKRKPKRKTGDKFERVEDNRGPESRFAGRNPPQRVRESKSMEHGWPNKPPPINRRHMTSLNVESLPPRLKKQYLLEGKGYAHIGGNSEENWDGGSLSFTNHGPQQSWTNTVPPPRGRGRARVEPDRKPDQRWNGERRGDFPGRAMPCEDNTLSSQLLSASVHSDVEKLETKTTPTPGILTLHSTPGKKMNWSDIVVAAEKDEMSRSSSQNSLNQHSFPLPDLPIRERKKKRGKDRNDCIPVSNKPRDRRTSEESSGRGSSRERSDWRRRDDDNWRKSGSDDTGSWRSMPLSAPPQVSAPAPTPAPTPAQQPTRGFLHIQPQSQRQLFDPSNPARPILVNATNIRTPVLNTSHSDTSPYSTPSMHYVNSTRSFPAVTDSVVNWNGYSQMHQPFTPDYSLARHPRHMEVLKNIEGARMEIYYALSTARKNGSLDEWAQLKHTRENLRTILVGLLRTDLKFCWNEHIISQIWTSSYYGVIETLKELMSADPERRNFHKESLLGIIDEGELYFKKLIQILEETYNFKVDDYVTDPGSDSPQKSHTVSMTRNMAQLVLLNLGDLARYKEDACGTVNYGKSKMYYGEAQQLNPKNGRPYYLLATIAKLSKRKIDYVYFYMRSLMATKPMESARESLAVAFDENRKRYESVLKSCTDERATDKENREHTGLRREIWFHPMGRRRVHRTTSASTERLASDEDNSAPLTSVEISRRFTGCFLVVHGKLFTKVGMERFQDAAVQMLKEFRVLLQFQPIPITLARFLQLTALNIFSIENTKLKDPPPEPGYRSAVQMNALIASLQMLNLMLERCLMLLKEQVAQGSEQLNMDLLLFLPAIKIWCDWLLTHGSLWSPPPCCDEYRVGPAGDCWVRLAALVNFLEEHPFWKVPIVTVQDEGYEPVKLPEDNTLLGFTPLNLYDPDQVFTPPDTDMEAARCCLRFRKILFFAEEFLCGLNPPILKMQKEEGRTVFVPVVQTSGPSPTNPASDDQSDTELLVESFSEDEDSDDRSVGPLSDDAETHRLLHRKEVLERRQQRQERHQKRVQALLEQNGLCVEVEVRPKYLVPDTNCFIDYLSELKLIASTSKPQSAEPAYILNVPLIVVTELEGLSRGGRHRDKTGLSLGAQAHNATVSEDAKEALAFLKTPGRNLASVKCVTPSGKVLKSFMPFAIDGETDRYETNDDKILATCLSLCKHPVKEEATKPGEPRRLTRDVVLLTDDRHLRVKALARDLPVRKVRDFIQWAELG